MFVDKQEERRKFEGNRKHNDIDNTDLYVVCTAMQFDKNKNN